MLKCPNLKQLAGKRYRLAYDPAYYAEHGKLGRVEDPWLLQVPGRRGHIYVHGTDRLGVATNSRGSTARDIAALPGVVVEQDGADGINASFPIEQFEHVAQLIQARRRRTLSAEQRQSATQRLARFRFPTARQSDFSPQNPRGAESGDSAFGGTVPQRSQPQES